MKKFEHIILVVIILLSFFVRLYKIGNPIADWHSWRQADTAAVSRSYIETGINLLYPTYYDISSAQTGYPNPEGYRFVEFPIFNLLHIYFYKIINIFGDSSAFWFVIAGRLVSISASLASLYFIYLISNYFWGKKSGLFSAFFFGLLPFNIYYSRAILPEELAVAFGIAAMWFFIKHFEKKKYLIVSAILFALSILTKPFTVFFSLPLIYFVWSTSKDKLAIIKNKKYWFYVIAIMLPFLAWRIWIGQFPEGIPHIKWAFNSDHILFSPAFERWIIGERLGRLILGIWGIVPFSYGILSKKKKMGFLYWFLIGSFLFVVILATANVRHDYYQIILIPSIAITLGIGASELMDMKGVVSKLLLTFSVLMMFGMSWYQIREYYKINHPEIVEAGERVSELIPKDALVIAPYNKDTAFLYQTDRKGWPYVEGSVDELIRKGATYFVSVKFDPVTIGVMDKYTLLEKTDKYVIVRLTD